MTPPAWEGEYVTTRQVAEFLGVHIRTVQRYARDGLLRSYRLPGDGYRYLRTDVEAFLVLNTPPDPSDLEE